jgi:hypothetical protein
MARPKGSRVEDNGGEALCLPLAPSRRICLLHCELGGMRELVE